MVSGLQKLENIQFSNSVIHCKISYKWETIQINPMLVCKLDYKESYIEEPHLKGVTD